MSIQRVDVARGIAWVEVPEIGLRILCGCPADAVKHLIKRGLIVERAIKGVVAETGPNAILLSDVPIQNGEFANLAEFPVLQMLYKQGMLIPGHPANTGHKPLLIGDAGQIEAQMRYIYRGNYGLVSREEIIETGVSEQRADEIMRLKLAFAFGRIRPSSDFLDACAVGAEAVEVAPGVSLRRLKTNVFEFAYKGESVAVDLNLGPGETYECPYPLAYLKYEPEYFSVIHSGEGDGWDVNRPSMSSVVSFQGRTYLIDAGPQISHVLTALGISIDQIDGIFQTHAHDDHCSGLNALMRAGRRIDYYATPLVRSSVAKKLAALIGLEEERFDDAFAVHDLVFDEWNDIDGLEVKPLFSPHPVETNIYMFRTLSGDGYRTYAHYADIVSLDVLKRMVTDKADAPGLSEEAFRCVERDYLTTADVKKIDVGGGLIHGAAQDFAGDSSKRILLAHRATLLTAAEREIGSSASFGTVDVLVSGESEGLRRHAFSYLQAHLPGVPVTHLRMLLNHPIEDVNPGAIILKQGEVPQSVMLLLSGRAEKIRTRDGTFGNVPVGSLLGDQALIDDRPVQYTYRACSFLRVMHIPSSLFIEILRRNRLESRRHKATALAGVLEASRLFGDGLPVGVLGRMVDGASDRVFQAGEDIDNGNLSLLNVIRSGAVERLAGHRVLEVLGKHDVFGEELAIFNQPCLHGFRARETTVVIQIPRELVEEVPMLRWKLLEFQLQRSQRLHGSEAPDLIAWDEGMSIGVARVDLQHRKLLEIGNAIIENLAERAARKPLLRIFEALAEFAQYHFGFEERLMAQYRYAGYEEHLRHHVDLLHEINACRDRFRSDEIPGSDEFRVVFEGWLQSHIEDDDRAYGRFLNERGIY